MGNPGDIHDELDDDGLRKSIESSSRSGQWRDEGSQFDDPKLLSIAKQLAEPPRATYTERRLAELDRRAAEKEKRAAVKAAAPPAAAEEKKTGPADWRETIVKPGAPAAPPPPVPGAPRPKVAAGALQWARTIGPATALFAGAIAAQTAVQGWNTGLGVRGAVAALATGIAWKLFGEGRYRSATSAASAHLIAFVSTGSASTSAEVFSSFFGAAIVMLGGAVLGMARER
jgi:hypothetical protein